MKTSPATRSTTGVTLWCGIWGLFLGFAILKFGNPVVLDRQIPPPANFAEALSQPWPLRWSYSVLAILAVFGLPLAWPIWRRRLPRLPPWLWVPLLVWLVWQFVSASRTVDANLTSLTLPHFLGLGVAYFLGLALGSERRPLATMLLGILAGFCYCLMQANTQRLVDFPADRAALIEGERTGWTNFPAAALAGLKRDGMILHTNGVDIANPVILSKLERGRVHGTLVYPNALAGAVLLLLPVGLFLLESLTRTQRPVIRSIALGLLIGLASTALLWSGSKSGWLIALGMAVALALRWRSPGRRQGWVILLVLAVGLTVFAVRFRGYFAAGATSVGARFDYWRAAAQTAITHPWVGTGPGTFQRPYAQLKAPESEMARLAHNDYLEQFSDSGWIGGLSYLIWAVSWSVLVGRWVWRRPIDVWFFAFLGVAAWLLQGLSEFGLYVPALGWTALTLAGAVTGAMAIGTTPSATPSRSAPEHT